MRWHWYIGGDYEVLLDVDSDRQLWYARERIRENEREGLLPLKELHTYRSQTPGHFHILITLSEPLLPIERVNWGWHLGSDPVRAQYAFMRIAHGLPGDFLISTVPYDGFRPPDYTCECREKHKEKKITGRCPVLRQLLGKECAAEYFSRRKRAVRKPWPVGRVPMRLIRQGGGR